MILVYFTLPAVLPVRVRCATRFETNITVHLRISFMDTLCVYASTQYKLRISKRVQHSTGRAKRVYMRAIHVILKSLRGALQLYTKCTAWGLKQE